MKANPRLAHLNRRHPGAEEAYQQATYQQPEPARQQREQLQPESVPRPIYPPTNIIPTYTKFALNINGPSYPAADSLFNVNVNHDAGPNFLRVTTGILPVHPKKVNLPLGAWVMPLGPDSATVPSITVKAPLRCARCKAYVNAYFKIDATNNIGCNLCGHRYTSQQKIDPAILNSTDLYTSGVLDFKVSDPLYFKKDFSKVKILLLIELTKSTIDTGLFDSIVSAARSTLESGQFDSGIRVGVATFSQSTVFYRVRGLEEELVEYVVSDPTDSLCPLSEKDLYFNPNEENSRTQLLYILDRIMEKAKNLKNINNATNYYSAVSCASTSFGNNAGRIVLFSLNDPAAAPGRLRQREKEEVKTPLKPIHEEYQVLAKDLVKKRIGLDHFLFGKEGQVQHELATTHFLTSSTGGSLYHYMLFSPTFDAEHLYFSIYGNLTRECAYDVNFTCRMSNGLSTTKFLVGDGIHEDRDVSLGVLDASHSVTVWFEQEDKLVETAFLQFAIMFTNSRSERVIRVINYRFLLSDKLDQVHQACDYLTLANLICKEHANQLPKQPDPVKIIEGIYAAACTILQQYRLDRGEAKYSELQVHPNMKHMLPYLHGVLTSSLFSNLGRNIADSRIAELLKLNTAGFLQFANRYYPKLYSIDLEIYNTEGAVPGDMVEDSDVAVLPSNLPLLASSIKQDSVYLVNNSEALYMLVMPQAQQDLLAELFGVEDVKDIAQLTALPELETGHNVRVANIIQELRRRQPISTFYLPLLVLVPSNSPQARAIFDEKLPQIIKEDNRERPYVQFLKQLHARLQTK